MSNLKDAAEIIIDDFRTLDTEIRKGLAKGSDNWTKIAQTMEESGYFEQLEKIRENLERLIEELQSRLQRLPDLAGALKEGAQEVKSRLKMNVEDIQDLLSRLMAVWDRLENLYTIVGQKLAAAGKAIGSAYTAVKGWFSTIKSWLVGISSQLWKLLCKLMTPKEWKISGEIGTGPFGLANVGVEITFGA